MLGQQLGVRHLLPLALARLRDDPFISGDYYPGDLLSGVLGLPAHDWDHLHAERHDLSIRLSQVVPPDDQPESLSAVIARFVHQ